MTLCVASVCDELTAIVTVSDSCFSVGAGHVLDFETDAVAVKMAWLSPGWHMMYSGDDISHIAPIVDAIREGLIQSQGDVPHGFRTVAHVCKSAFRDYWTTALNEKVFSRYGLTVDKFMADRRGFNAKERLFLFEEIAKFDIPLCFMVYGFGRDWCHIFTVSSPGIAQNHNSLGCWSIGGGADVQLSVLRNLTKSKPGTKDVANAIIDLCDAKFRVEGDGIGGTTLVTVANPADELFLPTRYMDTLKELWYCAGKPLQGTDRDAALVIVGEALENAISYKAWQKKLRDYRANPKKRKRSKPQGPG